MNETTFLSALAGLLHDIGKFAVRAAEGSQVIWDEAAQREYRYKHALLSSDFVHSYVPSQWRKEVLQGVKAHHNPKTRWERVITLADHLSAGERSDDTADDTKARTTHPRQLISIFCSLTGPDGEKTGTAYLPLKALRIDRDVIFPAPGEIGDIWQAYRALWNEFTAEAARLREAHEGSDDLAMYTESMQLLLQRFTSCIPSAYYKTRPDVSLYDHSRMTAALATILHDGPWDDAALQRMIKEPTRAGELALLVGGDISGVQDFIYTISSRGATSALRGRSFYLQLLTEAVVRFVLTELDLPITNVIYSGGGRFYLLARPADLDQLQAIQRHISRTLLQHHRGDLYVALTGLPLQGADFFNGKISAAWQQLGEALQSVKLRRFSELDASDLKWLFEAHGDGGNEDMQCQVCGLEHPGTRRDEKGDDDEGVRKCPTCLSYEDLGGALRQAKYLTLEHIGAVIPDLSQPPGRWQDVLANFGINARVTEELASSGGRGNALALRDDALASLKPDSGQATGRRLLVNVTPTITAAEIVALRKSGFREFLPEPGRIKPFSAMEWQSQGIKRLGVLRMDVDNLGKLFSNGFGKQATLSRVAALSFAISLYFDGWVEHLAEQMNLEDGQDRLYSIYSGGDDLFFVGSWDAVVEFARRVRRDLTPYAAGHPGIHTSAGIVLVGGKYPLSQAARDAGNAETEAKGFRKHGSGAEATAKDAICFLGEVQPWERFGLNTSPNTVHALAVQLVGMVQDNGKDQRAPAALIQNLARLYEQYSDAERQRQESGRDLNQAGEWQPLWGPWMWRSLYMLTRMANRSGDTATTDQIKTLRNELHETEFRDMTWIGLAARMADLLTRDRNLR